LSNAREKARLAAEHCGEWALADDSGLEVEALAWKPGVRSARYAGEGAGDEENWRKLLTELQGIPLEKRRAVFRSVVVLRHPDGRERIGEGELWGRIAEAPKGEGGFGYDPVFIPEGFERSLAELSPAEKNSLSHRFRALEALKRLGRPC
ncbi:MAG TPA: non-canonical purine NTP pyrophosphatase, partial [bacterium]|nr:non-canonical purine NTP pyrophosphatase [bacterium]